MNQSIDVEAAAWYALWLLIRRPVWHRSQEFRRSIQCLWPLLPSLLRQIPACQILLSVRLHSCPVDVILVTRIAITADYHMPC